jgi:predicted nucleic acid-binding protein
MREHPQFLSRLAALQAADSTIICPIVRGEILHGIERLPMGRRRTLIAEKASKAFGILPCVPLNESIGDHYARMRAECESKGVAAHENDLWIAAVSFQIGAVLVTRDRDLTRIAGVQVEDWTL